MRRMLLIVVALSSVVGFCTGLAGSFVGARLTAKPEAKPTLHASLCKSEDDPELKAILCGDSEEKVRVRAALSRLVERGASEAELDAFEARARALIAVK